MKKLYYFFVYAGISLIVGFLLIIILCLVVNSNEGGLFLVYLIPLYLIASLIIGVVMGLIKGRKISQPNITKIGNKDMIIKNKNY
jgi:hypothetical protein